VASRQDFDAIDSLIAHNVRRTQQALSSEEVRLGAHHFAGSTGYGRGDSGRRALDAAVAALVGGEAAVARPHFVSGTHAIAAALFGVLRPGDELLAVAGKPYDTLDPVIGIGEGSLEGEGEEEGDDEERRRRRSSSSPPPSSSSSLGSLKDWGVSFRALPLDEASTAGGGSLDWEALKSAVRPETRVALVQRSCGYSSERNTLTLAEIARAASALKASAAMVGNTRLVVAVDNCYGEFTEEREPGSLEGVDLVMGSFIKGLGGTVAPCGGYVCGRAELVEAAAARATAPGVGLDYGAIEGSTLRLLFQGLWLVRFFWDVPPPLFLGRRGRVVRREAQKKDAHIFSPSLLSIFENPSQAPHVVGEAMKGGRLVARVMEAEGYGGGGSGGKGAAHDAETKIRPPPGSPPPFPFVTCVPLGTADRLVAFCRAVQEGSPVGSFVRPTPGPAAGCSDEVVFGDGTFVDGSTGEMSADGPLRAPFAVYTQGGAHWSQWVVPLERAVEALRALEE